MTTRRTRRAATMIQRSLLAICMIPSMLISPSLGSFVGTTNPLTISRQHRINNQNPRASSRCVALSMSLKPAAIPLMDAGKALARSGELLVDVTSQLEIYGGGLSAAGAQVRNAGDRVAQAAASCRFKTGSELVCDELRESATCLADASSKLLAAVGEAQADKNEDLAQRIERMVQPMTACGTALESAGAGIMQRLALANIGSDLVASGKSLEQLSEIVGAVAPNIQDAVLSGQRMAYAAECIVQAGNNLMQRPPPKPKGKTWLKG